MCGVSWLVLFRGTGRQVVPGLGIQLPQVSRLSLTRPSLTSLCARYDNCASRSLSPLVVTRLNFITVPFDGIIKENVYGSEFTRAGLRSRVDSGRI